MTTQECEMEMDADQFEDFVRTLEMRREMEVD